MALMERVATLLRANIKDLLHRAEDPEQMVKEILLDMDNQLLQVKTQLAIALTDQYLLEKKKQELQDSLTMYQKQAADASLRGEDSFARGALARALTQEGLLAAFQEQLTHQTHDADMLRRSFSELQMRIADTKVLCELFLQRYRHGHLASRRRTQMQAPTPGSLPVDQRAPGSDRDERVEQLLMELKRRQQQSLPPS